MTRISRTDHLLLADYDINPKNNQDRSVALSLFEDKYGAKVSMSLHSDTKFDTLASRILAVTGGYVPV